MATVSAPLQTTGQALTESHAVLSKELRRLTRAATFVALATSPVAFYWFHHHNGWSIGKSLLVTFVAIIAFRGLVDILVRRVIPWPSLFGTDDARLREEDITNRRRAWTWRFFLRLVLIIGGAITLVYTIQVLTAHPGSNLSWIGTSTALYTKVHKLVHSPTALVYAFQIFFLFFANFFIFMGPLLLMGISQIRGFEPGDAEWGVKLDHVRGQAEAKEEIRRVVTLWQSGEVFESSGGKRERGLLFLGAPGTGKTMMAKAIATGFNSPFVSIPGSGFAQTFIGIDAVIVRFLARKAKKLAKKWGGQCIVFIDEIDAVGMRRNSLAGQAGTMVGNPLETWQPEYYGQWGAINPSGDIIVETAAWRDYIFAQRAPERRSPYPPFVQKIGNIVNQGIFPGLGGMQGGLALNQLLVVMDGIDNPPFLKRVFTNKTNAILDAIYFVPRRVGRAWGMLFGAAVALGGSLLLLNGLGTITGNPILYGMSGRHWIVWRLLAVAGEVLLIYLGVECFRTARKDGTLSLRLPRAKPTGAQIYFIGATNVPITALDPALTRPGRMGRHITFRTPTKEDRKDIFDLYLEKVAHDPELDTDERRDEIARITSGYSPAMIDQICSMALTNAHHEGLPAFNYKHLVDAMTVIESGTAVNVTYTDDEAHAVAIHEAGHAAAAHVYVPERESSRLSIKMRGGSLGHHQSFEKEERFSAFQSRMFATLIHAVGAMAAELVFFGENSIGVGGDLQSTTWTATGMVGAAGMSPLPVDLHGKTFADENEDQTRERVMRRFEDIGFRLMNRTASGWEALQDPRKRSYAAQFVGEAFVTAYNLILLNKDKVEKIADKVLEEKEIYGNDLVRFLDEQNFVKPEIDWTDENVWPKFMNYSPDRDDDKDRKGKGEGMAMGSDA
jgi:ATP-dependent Zn protease